MLRRLCREGEITVVICGCCERSLLSLLTSVVIDAGAEERLSVRHYIDVREDGLESRLMNIMPMLSKKWYNARLVDEAHCPQEMAAIYRVNMICLVKEEDGVELCHMLLQCDSDRFFYQRSRMKENCVIEVVDSCRFRLETLKPRVPVGDGSQPFVDYTAAYAELERDCVILSVKPDLHFNLVPVELLYQAICDGFSQSGLVEDEGLAALIGQLYEIHVDRVRNMHEKRRPTQIVYSYNAMERFAVTGVQTDHFFIQRAYTPQERRVILQSLLQLMQQNPYFNIYFLRPELPEIRCEMTMYGGKGILLMDAYTSYDLHDDHSEALITLPSFQDGFQRFFRDKLLRDLVLPRQESVACMERLLAMIP